MRVFVSVLTLATLAPQASADRKPLVPDAGAEMQQGLAHFKAREYAAAIIAFDQGYAIDPSPDFLYAKAQAQRLGGDCRSAIETYTKFLASQPPDDEAAMAHGNIARCEHVFAASGNEPEVSARALPRAEPPRTVEVVPWFNDHAGLALGACAVLSLGVSVGFVLATNANATDTATVDTLIEWEGRRDAYNRDRVIAGVAAGLGGALAIGAAVRFWSVARRHEVVVTTGGTTSLALVVGGRW